MNRWWVAAVAIVLVPLLGYPLLTIAGGAPRFPSTEECVHAPVEGMPVNVVFARLDDLTETRRVHEYVLSVGFAGTELLGDGCGRWIVVLENVPSAEIGKEVQREAGTVDLRPTLELGTDT